MNQLKEFKLPIIIFSCFKYRSLWPLCLNSWRREIGSLRNNIVFYISTDLPDNINKEIYEKELGCQMLIYPKNISWVKAAALAIEKVPEISCKYLITTFDDLLVNQIKICEFKNLLDQIFSGKSVNYLKLINHHSSLMQRLKKFKLYELSQPMAYLGSMVLTLWSRKYVLKILENPKLTYLNAWEYEKEVSDIINYRSSVFYTNKNLISFANIIRKGNIDIFAFCKYAFFYDLKIFSIFYHFPRMNLIKLIFTYIYIFFYKIIKSLLPFKVFKTITDKKNIRKKKDNVVER